MAHSHRPVMTHRRLLLLKWLMVVIPPVTVSVGHTLLLVGHRLRHDSVSDLPALPEIVLVTSLVTLLALVISYLFVETLFRVLRSLQAEALAHEHDMLTMNAVMQERERLSRELHDGVAQLVGHLLLRLDTIKDLVEADRRREAGTELERLYEVADEIYVDIGESISGLRTNVAERGLVRALQDYVDQFEERLQIHVSLRVDDVADQLPPVAALQFFRLIQEALTNVRKHAAAREAMVALTSDGSGQMKVVIVDDGQGFVPSAERNGNGRPLGLTSMRERVESLGGTFQVQSEPGSGTRVTATIPSGPSWSCRTVSGGLLSGSGELVFEALVEADVSAPGERVSLVGVVGGDEVGETRSAASKSGSSARLSHFVLRMANQASTKESQEA